MQLRRLHRCALRHSRSLSVMAAMLAVSLLFYFALKDRVPRSLDAGEWRNATIQLTTNQTQFVSPRRLAIVASLFVPQVVFGAPFLNITKMLCGYWFGLLWGWLVCVLAEVALSYALSAAFLRFVDSDAVAEDAGIYLKSIRTRTQLVLLHLTSMPFQARIFVLKAGVFTAREFWASFCLVSMAMSLKNALIGDLLFNRRLLWLALSLAALFTLLPSVFTVYVFASGYANLRLQQDEPANHPYRHDALIETRDDRAP